MDPPPADGVPSEHQRRCIERMLQTTDKFNIVPNLIAWNIHFAFPDALTYAHDMNSNESPGPGLDVFGPFRLYNTFSNGHRDCLASLAGVPHRTVKRWILESGTYSTGTQASLHSFNARFLSAENHSSTTERSESASLIDPSVYRQPTTSLRPPNKVRVDRGYFSKDCLLCFDRGFDIKSRKQLHTHLKMDMHTKEYKVNSILQGFPDRYHCCRTDFDGKDSWADHVVVRHCRSSDVPAYEPSSGTQSSSSYQGTPTPGSSSSRLVGRSPYQGTPGSGATTNIGSPTVAPHRLSGGSSSYGRFSRPFDTTASFENAATPASQPHLPLESPCLPQTATPFMPPIRVYNEQFLLAIDPHGNPLYDHVGNNIVCAHNEQFLFTEDSFGNLCLDNGGKYIVRTHDGQPAFAQNKTGNLVRDKYGVSIPIVHGQLLYAPLSSGGTFTYCYGIGMVQSRQDGG